MLCIWVFIELATCNNSNKGNPFLWKEGYLHFDIIYDQALYTIKLQAKVYHTTATRNPNLGGCSLSRTVSTRYNITTYIDSVLFLKLCSRLFNHELFIPMVQKFKVWSWKVEAWGLNFLQPPSIDQTPPTDPNSDCVSIWPQTNLDPKKYSKRICKCRVPHSISVLSTYSSPEERDCNNVGTTCIHFIFSMKL